METLTYTRVETEAIQITRNVMKRLYAENRLTGDDMRDAAALLNHATREMVLFTGTIEEIQKEINK